MVVEQRSQARRIGVARRSLLGLASVVSAVVLLTGCLTLTSAQSTTLNQLNYSRNQNGLPSLPPFSQSVTKAQNWANYLASVGTLSHTYLPSGYTVGWCMLGENVGYGPSTSAVETAFMNSPEHRANILGRAWNYAGTGVAWRGSTVFVVQEFIERC